MLNKNNDIETITIESDGGTEFYYDMGHPNLICKINNEDKQDDYAYYWSYQSSTGVFEDLTGEDPNYEKQRQYEEQYPHDQQALDKPDQQTENPVDASDDRQCREHGQCRKQQADNDPGDKQRHQERQYIQYEIQNNHISIHMPDLN